MQEISQNLQESLKKFGLTTKQAEALIFYAMEGNDPPKWWIDKIKRRTGEDTYHQAWLLARVETRAEKASVSTKLTISFVPPKGGRSPVHASGMSTSWRGSRKTPSKNN